MKTEKKNCLPVDPLDALYIKCNNSFFLFFILLRVSFTLQASDANTMNSRIIGGEFGGLSFVEHPRARSIINPSSAKATFVQSARMQGF